MVKKVVRRGRSERRSQSYFGPYVELLSDARTKQGRGAFQCARAGWVRRADFFHILRGWTAWIRCVTSLQSWNWAAPKRSLSMRLPILTGRSSVPFSSPVLTAFLPTTPNDCLALRSLSFLPLDGTLACSLT